MKIVFFGASVTEQAISRDGIKTGYVAHLKSLFEESNFDVDIVQKGFGSSSFNAAGFIYANEVKELKPDIVVLEWHTTWLGKFDSSKYFSVIASFLKAGIKVVNLVLPRREAIEPERECVKQSRAAIKQGAFFLNLIDHVENGIDLNQCLRDYVHTSEKGGAVYAQYIYNFLVEEVFKSDSSNPLKKSTNFDVEQYFEDIACTSLPFEKKLLPGNKLKIEFEAIASEVQIFAEMRVGPYSPKLCMYGGTNTKISIWDEWCGYERNCLKALTPVFSPKDNYIVFEISEERPKYEKSKYDFSHVIQEDLKCVFKRNVYCIGAEIKSIKLISN